jgi:membrane protein required for colicin V production
LVAVLLLGGILNRFMGMLVNSTGLTGTDRLIGVFFGAARGGVVVATLILLAGLTAFPRDPWWHDSQLIPYFQDLALWLKGFLPPDIAKNFQY